ncbi:unnamed protein product [Fraxinus pennsylvanica]|uniref:SDE2/SF3A3 SAP domain-containing protein n=1 Tax=Fraxinus pennsylvanica TaxID=56036 RepID=A0AAD2E767_9LAMI|nr:unnamed protein product [Fraxinus pennsylvanica]
MKQVHPPMSSVFTAPSPKEKNAQSACRNHQIPTKSMTWELFPEPQNAQSACKHAQIPAPHGDSSKEAERSSDSVIGGKPDADKSYSGVGSEEEDTVAESLQNLVEVRMLARITVMGNIRMNLKWSFLRKVDELAFQLPGVSSSEEGASAIEGSKITDSEPVHDESVSRSLKDSDEPVNFNGFDSAAELELQARGLKCGGTLQVRAGRLFLLKTTPFEMLPKKLFAKK